VDATVVHGVLAGLLVLAAAVWVWYVHNRLWQGSILREAADGLRVAKTVGLQMAPLGFSARVNMSGRVDGIDVRMEWRGGPMGAVTLVRIGDQEWKYPLITTDSGIRAALRPDAEGENEE